MIMEGSEPKIIPNAEGSRLTPSVVAFTDKGDVLVGEPARRQAVTNPRRTVFSIKRFMGRRHSEVTGEEKMVPYEVFGPPEEYVKVRVRGKEYTPDNLVVFKDVCTKEVASAQQQLQYLQWALPVLTGAVVVLGAQQGEQQRASQILAGVGSTIARRVAV